MFVLGSGISCMSGSVALTIDLSWMFDLCSPYSLDGRGYVGPRHTTSRFLAQTLQSLTGKSESHITNSMDFIQKIQKIRLRPTDLLVSFDIESLFTQVPIKDTLKDT